MVPSLVAQRYKGVQVKTSSPGELLLLTYEGLFRYLREAAAAMRAGQRARAGEQTSRAHAILEHLCTCLKPSEAPALCENLMALYCFCMREVVQANIAQDPDRIDTILRILTPLRDAWVQAVKMTAQASGF
jgi:flagellar protein FliS